MLLTSTIFIGIIALLHWYICILEMFLWDRAVRVFRVPKDMQQNEKLQNVFRNLGLYNGFLAAGLTWGTILTNESLMIPVRVFFLSCVAIAGIYGAMTAQIRILFIQTIPAAIAGLFLALAVLL